MKKGLLMMLCLSLLATAPACNNKKKAKSEKSQPAKVKKTKTYTKKEKAGKVVKRKTERKSKTSKPHGKVMRTESVVEDMTMNTVAK